MAALPPGTMYHTVSRAESTSPVDNDPPELPARTMLQVGPTRIVDEFMLATARSVDGLNPQRSVLPPDV